MREIKFRTWDKVNKCWLDYDELFINQEGEIYEIEERSWAYQTYMHKENLTEKLELVQFTGLKDKHGKEIYEGDIVKGKNRLFENQVMAQEVTFLKGCFMFGNWNAHEYFNRHQEIEVIGNIYENPDLLEQEDNQ